MLRPSAGDARGADAGCPWRSVGVGAASLGGPVGIAVLHPLVGMVTAGIELTVLLVVVFTALFGSEVLSERAFRLLRWFANRPSRPIPVTAVRLGPADHSVRQVVTRARS